MTTGFQNELDLLVEEYKALRQELILTMGNTRDMMKINFTVLGVFIAGTPYILNNKQYFLFLIVPLFLFGLLATFLRYMLLHIEIVEHIREIVIPKARDLLKEIEGEEDRNYCGILSWEEESGSKSPFSRYSPLLWPIPVAPTMIPLLGACISIVVYIAIMLKNHSVPSSWEVSLLFVNIILAIYLVIVGALVSSRFIKTSNIREISNKRIQPTSLKLPG